MGKIINSIKSCADQQYRLIFDKSVLTDVPEELMGCINKNRNWMFVFIPVAAAVFIITGFSLPVLGACMAVELMLFWNYMNIKRYITEQEYTVISGVIQGLETPWYRGGALNKSRKTENKTLILEQPATRRMIKVSMGTNVAASLEKGSLVRIYAKDLYENNDGILIVAAYFTIVNETAVS